MIEFHSVSKIYKNQIRALEDVSFSINDGEFVFLIGESGAGKSTLIKLLTCEEMPTRGAVVLDSYRVSKMPRRLVPFLRRKIGMIFQDFRLIDSKTVYENVAFAMEIVGAPKRVIQRRVPIVLSVVGLRNKANAYPQELSGGEAQRVGIARAMVNNPRLILADEPTGNLDPQNSEAIMALLDEINRAGTTVVACTHDVEMVNRMRKRVIEFSHGRLIRDEAGSGYQVEPAVCYLPARDEYLQMEELIERRDQDVAAEAAAEGQNAAPEIAEDEQLDQAIAKKAHDNTLALKERLQRDSERRQNRESLAVRIARMRIACDGELGDHNDLSESEVEEAVHADKLGSTDLPLEFNEDKYEGDEDEYVDESVVEEVEELEVEEKLSTQQASRFRRFSLGTRANDEKEDQ